MISIIETYIFNHSTSVHFYISIDDILIAFIPIEYDSYVSKSSSMNSSQNINSALYSTKLECINFKGPNIYPCSTHMNFWFRITQMP